MEFKKLQKIKDVFILARYCFGEFRKRNIVDQFFNVAGYEIEVRCLPSDFKHLERKICNLMDDKNFDEARKQLEWAVSRYGSDQDLIRLDGYLHCEEEFAFQDGL